MSRPRFIVLECSGYRAITGGGSTSGRPPGLSCIVIDTAYGRPIREFQSETFYGTREQRLAQARNRAELLRLELALKDVFGAPPLGPA